MSISALRAQYATTIKNAGVLILGKIIVFAISFFLLAAFGRLASKTTLGSYNYIVSITTIISITTLPGMNGALLRAIAKGHEGSFRSMTHKRMCWGMLGALITLSISSYYFIQGNTTLGASFLIAALFIPLTDTMSDMALLYWQGKKDFKKSVSINIAYQLLFTIPSIITLFLTDNLTVIIASFFFFQALAGFIIYRHINPTNDVRDSDSESFGSHLSIMYAFRLFSMHVDKLLVWQLFNPAMLAIYSLAIMPITKLEQLIPIEQLALPVLSITEASSEKKKMLLRKMGQLCAVTIPILILFFFLAPLAYRILFPAYADSVPLFRVLLITLAFSPLLFLRTAFIAWRKQQQLYILEIISPIIKTALVLSGGIAYGIPGIILGVCISKAIDGIITLILFQKLQPVIIDAQ